MPAAATLLTTTVPAADVAAAACTIASCARPSSVDGASELRTSGAVPVAAQPLLAQACQTTLLSARSLSHIDLLDILQIQANQTKSRELYQRRPHQCMVPITPTQLPHRTRAGAHATHAGAHAIARRRRQARRGHRRGAAAELCATCIHRLGVLRNSNWDADAHALLPHTLASLALRQLSLAVYCKLLSMRLDFPRPLRSDMPVSCGAHASPACRRAPQLSPISLLPQAGQQEMRPQLVLHHPSHLPSAPDPWTRRRAPSAARRCPGRPATRPARRGPPCRLSSGP